MSKLIVLIFMLYMHIIDDYKIQGILASMKQKDWWKKNAPDEIYQNDYLMALYEHAFCWTVSINIPILVYSLLCNVHINRVQFILTFFCMWMIHAIVDNLKANDHFINLITDQIIHILQVISCWLLFVLG